ncbi:MAG: iron-sulfur cluster-binding protein Rieske family [Gammaproteobacteria bacterium]|nr:iron-sulfur cluster-binding protein Rieske family [Gammaproteobacteria bacterium]
MSAAVPFRDPARTDSTALREHVAALLDSRRRGYALPGAFFCDAALYAAELELIFGRHWLFVASEPEIPEGGDYRTFDIGPYPIFVLRRDDGSIVAFHNTCRHRGTRILQQPAGVVGSNLVCPYHRWVYDETGRLIGCGASELSAPMEGLRLKSVHVKRLAGLIFVCLAAEPPDDFPAMAAQMEPYLLPHAVARTRVAKQIDLIEHGNWKLTIENNRECFHCAGHPELSRSLFDFFGDIQEDALSPQERAAYASFQTARKAAIAGWERAGIPWQLIEKLHGRPTGFRTDRLVLNGAGESMTMDTRRACARLLGNFTDARLGSLHFHVQPNAWFHFLADHIVTFATLPLDAGRTLVRTTWLVDAAAQEGRDYDLENLTRIWVETNKQDATLVEEAHRGASSPAYEPGPLVGSEFMVGMFHSWYEERLRAALNL